MHEFRIYVDDELVSVSHNEFVQVNNLASLTREFGKDRIKVKSFKSIVNDEEKLDWVRRTLNSTRSNQYEKI